MSFNNITVINKPFTRWRHTTVRPTTTITTTATATTAITTRILYEFFFFFVQIKAFFLFQPHGVYQI